MMDPSKNIPLSELRRQFEIFFRAFSQLANQNSVFCMSQSELSDPDRKTGGQQQSTPLEKLPLVE